MSKRVLFTEKYWVGQVKNANLAGNIHAQGRGESNVARWRESVKGRGQVEEAD
jgi:hypothetical protein